MGPLICGYFLITVQVALHILGFHVQNLANHRLERAFLFRWDHLTPTLFKSHLHKQLNIRKTNDKLINRNPRSHLLLLSNRHYLYILSAVFPLTRQCVFSAQAEVTVCKLRGWSFLRYWESFGIFSAHVCISVKSLQRIYESQV